MVIAYWLIGREIVEDEQHGKARAEYGKRVIEDLSRRLTECYGKGFSVSNIWSFRQFYLVYGDRRPEILHPMGRELKQEKKLHPTGGESPLAGKGRPMSDELQGPKRYPLGNESATGFHPDLSWSHYRALMRVENKHARSFYEIEAAKDRWNKRQLERQINSLLFERLSKSRDKEGILQLANEGQTIESPVEAIKDPYVLEFLDLPESHQLAESDLEAALINHLQSFLLELGTGFAFVGRQKRLTLDGDHFYPDLIFYHTKLQCYVIIDLKTGKLTHGDLGQIQMYVNYYDREVCNTADNPTIGLILCTDKNDSVVRYVLDEANRQIYASRYRLELPSEDELRQELERERRSLGNHVNNNDRNDKSV